ncbi:MAG: hypothetical protein U1F09_10660 [Steroidobacteraceae bacterium]
MPQDGCNDGRRRNVVPRAGWSRLTAGLLIGMLTLLASGRVAASGVVQESGLSLQPHLDWDTPVLADLYEGESVYFVARLPENSTLAGGMHRLDYRWLAGERAELTFGGSRQLEPHPKAFWAIVHPGHFSPGPHTAVLLIDGKEVARHEFVVHSGKRPSDQQVRDDIAAQGRQWLLSGDTASFDATADRYRRTEERTPAGYWKLAWLYHAANTFDDAKSDAAVWSQLDATCERWRALEPVSVAAVVTCAKIRLAQAWAMRGAGYARDVPEQNMARFDSLVESARRILDEHVEFAPRDPEWNALRISIAMAQNESSASIFERASRALEYEPLYYGIHFATERALEPQWGGSEEWIRRYVDLALDRSRAREGTQAYVRIYFSVAKNARNALDTLNLTGAKQPAMIASFKEVLKAFPDEHNRQVARAMMCFGGDAAQYRALGGPVSSTLPPIAWWDTTEWRRGCDAWAYEGRIEAPSVVNATRGVVSFLEGMGRDFWGPIGAVVVVCWLLVELLLRSVSRPTYSDESVGDIDLNDSTLYPRKYFVRWRQVAVSNGLAIRVTIVGAASAWALSTVPWPVPFVGIVAFGLCALASLGSFWVVVRRLGTRVVLTSDVVEVRSLLRSRWMTRAAIARRSPFGWRGRAVVVYGPAGSDARLEIPFVQASDEIFWKWFEPLQEFVPDR